MKKLYDSKNVILYENGDGNCAYYNLVLAEPYLTWKQSDTEEEKLAGLQKYMREVIGDLLGAYSFVNAKVNVRKVKRTVNKEKLA